MARSLLRLVKSLFLKTFYDIFFSSTPKGVEIEERRYVVPGWVQGRETTSEESTGPAVRRVEDGSKCVGKTEVLSTLKTRLP